MQLIEAEKKENTGITALLKGMEISDKIALEVNKQDVDSVRAIITRLHKDTNLRFTTEKNPTGIRVWRLTDFVPEV